MKKYYVSLTKDLIGWFLVFQADSKETVRTYLEQEYYHNGDWRLPWCGVYDAQEFAHPSIGVVHGIIESRKGELTHEYVSHRV